MLTAEGCRQRRQRFAQGLDPFPTEGFVVLADPLHLVYLANFYVDPISSGAAYGGFLILRRDGHATLLHDGRLPKSVQQAHADETEVLTWYDGQSPGRGPRELVPRAALSKRLGKDPPPVHDGPSSPDCARVAALLYRLRRQKGPDEIAILESCMRATDAGHAWARAHLEPGMTELDVYRGVNSACIQAAGHPVVVYGDFAVSGPGRRGGGPTERVLQPGDLFILDYSVVINGYRSDFTNTLAVGREPTAGQQRLYDLCRAAMAAGETVLRAGAPCQTVYDAVRGVFEKEGVAQYFPHHAGHGLGLAHPEAPYFVRHSDETVLENEVVTLEPGLYLPDAGGPRIENNYLTTKEGYRQLSHHTIALR
jgi:Xaa-Pro aminopeptidase